MKRKLIQLLFKKQSAICLIITPFTTLPESLSKYSWISLYTIPFPDEAFSKIFNVKTASRSSYEMIQGKNIKNLPIPEIQIIPMKKIEEQFLGDFRKVIEDKLSFSDFIDIHKKYLGIIHRILIGELKNTEYESIVDYFLEYDYIFEKSSNISKVIIGVDLKIEEGIYPFIVVGKNNTDNLFKYTFENSYIRRKKLRKILN